MFKRTEIDPAILDKLPDAKSKDKYLYEIFLMKIIERVTYAFLIATCSTIAGLLIDFFE